MSTYCKDKLITEMETVESLLNRTKPLGVAELQGLRTAVVKIKEAFKGLEIHEDEDESFDPEREDAFNKLFSAVDDFAALYYSCDFNKVIDKLSERQEEANEIWLDELYYPDEEE